MHSATEASRKIRSLCSQPLVAATAALFAPTLGSAPARLFSGDFEFNLTGGFAQSKLSESVAPRFVSLRAAGQDEFPRPKFCQLRKKLHYECGVSSERENARE